MAFFNSFSIWIFLENLENKGLSLIWLGFSFFFLFYLEFNLGNHFKVEVQMATSQLTASSISARSLPSFEGLRPSPIKFASTGHVSLVNLNQQSFRSLVVKAATLVASKVIISFQAGSLPFCLTSYLNCETKDWFFLWYVGGFSLFVNGVFELFWKFYPCNA